MADPSTVIGVDSQKEVKTVTSSKGSKTITLPTEKRKSGSGAVPLDIDERTASEIATFGPAMTRISFSEASFSFFCLVTLFLFV